jgi:hypothetical protein
MLASGSREGPWVLHDLIRSFVTHFSEREVFPRRYRGPINHIRPARSGVAGHYHFSIMLEERRKTVDAPLCRCVARAINVKGKGLDDSIWASSS